jgi:hypothetical protein
MAITVDSSQWTGQRDDTPLPVPVVWGEFESEAARDSAMARLLAAGAHHTATPSGVEALPVHAANEAQVAAPDTDSAGADRRNQRELEVGMAMAATSMAAAGLVIATGGAALAAGAAAAAAGAVTAVVGETVAHAFAPGSAQGENSLERPRADGPVIGLKAADAAAMARAEAALREAGARRVFVQRARAG